MPRRVSPDILWHCDAIQFARLIAEAESAGLFEDEDRTATLLDSMDLTLPDLDALVDRADAAWQSYKDNIPLAAPLTAAEARDAVGADGMLSGVVLVDLDLFLENDLEGVLDALGTALVEGGEILEQISYEVVASRGNELFVRVTGDPSSILGLAEESNDETED